LELKPKIYELIKEITGTNNKIDKFLSYEKQSENHIKICFSLITLEDFYLLNELLNNN